MWLLQKKKVAKIDDINVNKILVSKEELYGTNSSFKYFIGYNDNDVIRPLCIRLPQMTAIQKCQQWQRIVKKVQLNMEKSLLNVKFDSNKNKKQE